MTFGTKDAFERNVTLESPGANWVQEGYMDNVSRSPNMHFQGQHHEQGGLVGEDTQIHSFQWLKGASHRAPKPKLNPKWAQ